MDLIEHRFDENSEIKYRIFTCDISGQRSASALVLRFAGTYGFGSAGNGDGEFMRTITLCALSLWKSHAVVFDMRDLDYEWGDAIWSLYGSGFRRSGIDGLPYCTVISERCREGFQSCEGIVGPLFDDLDAAIENVKPRAQEYLAELWKDIE